MTTHNIDSFDSQIVLTFLGAHHGIWYDEIITETDQAGGLVRRLSNNPRVSDGFRRLYSAAPNDELGLFRIIPRGADKRKIAKAIRSVLSNHCQAASDTVEARTIDGKGKIIEVYVREFISNDGRPILASMHSDLTVSNNGHWILPTIADRIGAFIFVKRWDGSRFRFTFCNAELARAFGTVPERVIGLSDEDFFDDRHLIESFFRDDQSVFGGEHAGEPLVREESFRLRRRNMVGAANDRRLLTFKTRLDLAQGTSESLVLGISIDITEVTDVLRAVSELSDKAIYVKDHFGRYVAANQHFSRLLGKQFDFEVLHRTLEEILDDGKPLPASGRHKLLAKIQAEDNFAMERGAVTSVRTADLHDGREWLTEKKRFFAGRKQRPHIVGMASPLFPSSLWHVLESMPQCVSVKSYQRVANGQSDEFRYVWANKSYLHRHRFSRLEELTGKTDFDICTRDGASVEQALRFVEKDRLVLQICMDLHAKKETSSDGDWNNLVESLRENKCWEYREDQVLQGAKRSLQTSKWAENICDRWFVIVVYSDVTLGDVEIRRYHRMTVHGLREMVSPIDPAISWLSRLNNDLRRSEIDDSLRLLRQVKSDSEWFLRHHLDLFDLKVNFSTVTISEAQEICSDIVEKRRLCSDPHIVFSVSLSSSVDSSSLTTWKTDVRFLRVVLAELLLNATKWVISKMNAVNNVYDSLMTIEEYRKTGWHDLALPYKPLIEVSLEATSEAVSICVKDNGSATSNHAHRTALLSALTSGEQSSRGVDERLGIRFCQIAIERAAGALTVGTDESITSIKMNWPLR